MRRRTSRTPRAMEPPSLFDRTRRFETSRNSAGGDRVPAPPAGLGPYEAQYDVSLGYTEDRSITVQ